MDVRLDGRTAAITGGGRGIGRAIGLALARAGASVALLARTGDEINAVAGEIEANGGRALAVQGDVTNPDDVDAFFARIRDFFGGLQILINNAGGARWVRPAEELDLEHFRKGIDLNLSAAHSCMQTAAAMLFERPDQSSVLNIASILAARSVNGMSYYSAAKAGLVAYSQSAAREWGPRGVRVNCIGPGWIETDLSAPLQNENGFYLETLNQIPLKRWGRPDEVASAALFLVSDHARYITGSTLFIDGGLLT